MSINTHCQALLQWNKHNEQQLHIHVKLRNLGNQRGKTPIWENSERERDFISFRKDISATKLQFSAREIHLQHPNFALENMPSPHCCMAHPKNNTLENMLIICCTAPLQQKNPQKSLDLCAFLASKFMPYFPCCTDCTDPYSMTSNNNNKYQYTHTKNCLGKCSQSPLGNAASLLPTFLS
jgi:hypothetical protein